jgi:stearoyl-CoA desaturase (delta-9 desaturase)
MGLGAMGALAASLVSTLTSLPYTQFRRSATFYLWYDAFYAVLTLSLIALMHATGFAGLTATWSWELLLLLPLACHAQILCSVYIHNATHTNFPRAINRIVGELCGVVVLTRFASWEIIHQRHHKYSDDAESDPHPIVPGATGYWRYLGRTVVSVEAQLQKMFFEQFGDDARSRRFQRYRAVGSFTTSFLLLPYAWYLLLGAPAFVLVFLPASLVGFFHLIHFNWATHNPWSPTGDHRPVNLDSGFFRVGNLLWHGIYFHGNHHEKASLFNPVELEAERALPVIVPGDRTDHYPPPKRTKGTRFAPAGEPRDAPGDDPAARAA